MEKLLEMQQQLMDKIPHGHVIKDIHQAQVVAGFGIIEEVLEYLNAIGFKSWRPNPLPREAQLEEITDVLFFYLEEVILSGFSWAEVEEQYIKKHAENLERYRKVKLGDFSWDKRAEERL